MSENSAISRLGAQGSDDIQEQLQRESRSGSMSRSSSSGSESENEMIESQMLGIEYFDESDSGKSDSDIESYYESDSEIESCYSEWDRDDFMRRKYVSVSYGCGSQSSTVIAARLARAKQLGIKDFEFYKVEFDDVIASAWADCIQGVALKELKLVECSGQLDVVLQCGYEHMSLEKMDLSSNDSTVAFNTALGRTAPGLKSLDMLEIGFEDDGAYAILTEGLQNNTTLETLAIRDSPTTDLEVAKLLRALSSHPKLKNLDLSGGQGGQQAVQALQHLLSMSDLHDLRFTRQYTAENGYLVGAQNGLLASALRGNQCLRKLDLSSNDLGDEALDSLAQAFSTCRMLEVLYLSKNVLRDTDLETLLSHLPSTLKMLDVSENEFTEHRAEKLLLTALEESPRLSHISYYQQYTTICVIGRDIQHLMDFNWIGRILFCDRNDLPLSVWPVVLGRAIQLGSVSSTDALFHMLQGPQPSGSLLSVLVQGRLSEK
jgi:Ran GTPase-activating protein (RanGAP) involved in mRNA processing and transport